MLINPRLLFAWRFGTHRYALLTFGLYSDLRQCCWCWCDWWYEQESAKHSEALNAITQHLGAGSYLEASARWSTRRSHNRRYCTNTHNQTAHELTNQLFCMPWYMIRHSSDLPWRPFGGFNSICLCIMIFYFFPVVRNWEAQLVDRTAAIEAAITSAKCVVAASTGFEPCLQVRLHLNDSVLLV